MTMTIEDMSERERVEFLSEIRQPQRTKDRRQEIADRVAIQTDDFDYLIRRRVMDVYHQPEIAAEVSRWAIGLFNPQKVAVRRIAVGYKRRPTRKIKKNKAQSKLLTDLYRRIRFNKHAQRFHTMSVATNRGLVLAEPLRDRKGPTVGLRFITGANAEVIEEPGTTNDHPPGVLGVLLPPEDPTRPFERRTMMVDSRWYTVFDAQDRIIEELTFEHGLGRFPGAWMDHNDATENDAFNHLDGKGMTKTTAEVGFIAATMGWTRKSQCRKLLTMIFDGEDEEAEEDGAPEGQTLHDPEAVSVLTGEVQFLVNDINTAVTEFLSHIDELDRRAFEQLTGAPATPNPSLMQNPAAAANQLHAASSEAHGNIVETLEAFEEDMAEVVAAMSTRLRMPEAISPELARDQFDSEFKQLPFLETPKERNEIWKQRIALGVGDAVGFYAELFGVSEEEARERVKELQERQAEMNEIRASRQTPGDGNLEGDPGLVGESDEQKTGRFGGRASSADQSAAE
ncbi:MAG: hypothetical protein ACRBN8_22465 [Nannocystales bacterium]